jgi:hypothetical protein
VRHFIEVIASQKTDGMTPDLYQQLLRLLESSIIIRIYSGMKSKTQRIPVQHMSRFLLFLSFGRQPNKLYLMSVRILKFYFHLGASNIGIIVTPFVVIGIQ